MYAMSESKVFRQNEKRSLSGNTVNHKYTLNEDNISNLLCYTSTQTLVSNSQVTGCEDRLRNDLYCVGWGVKLYSVQSNPLKLWIQSPIQSYLPLPEMELGF